MYDMATLQSTLNYKLKTPNQQLDKIGQALEGEKFFIVFCRIYRSIRYRFARSSGNYKKIKF